MDLARLTLGDDSNARNVKKDGEDVWMTSLQRFVHLHKLAREGPADGTARESPHNPLNTIAEALPTLRSNGVRVCDCVSGEGGYHEFFGIWVPFRWMTRAFAAANRKRRSSAALRMQLLRTCKASMNTRALARKSRSCSVGMRVPYSPLFPQLRLIA